MFRIRPSKPMAVISAFVGIGMIVFALTSGDFGGNTGFLVFWVFVVIAIVGGNLWSAFSSKGSTYTIERTDEIP